METFRRIRPSGLGSGCASGRGSIAIVFRSPGCDEDQAPIQIFASDVSEQSLQHARRHVSESIAKTSQKERLRHFFQKIEGGYRVAKGFAKLSLLERDLTATPFAKIDLVSCRNVLITSDRSCKGVSSVLHYALKPSGILWLGDRKLSQFSKLFAAGQGNILCEEERHRCAEGAVLTARPVARLSSRARSDHQFVDDTSGSAARVGSRSGPRLRPSLCRRR
jgi:hypothetical protein